MEDTPRERSRRDVRRIAEFPRYRFGRASSPASERRYLAGFKGNLRTRFNDLRTRLTALDDGERMVIRGGEFLPGHLRVTAAGEAREVPRDGELSYTEILFDSCFARMPRRASSRSPKGE